MFRRRKDVHERNGEKYEKCYIESYDGKEVFAIREHGIDLGVTHKSEDLFNAVKDLFGEFVNAKVCSGTEGKMEYDNVLKAKRVFEDEDRYLVLIDDAGNQLHLTGCSCGYAGTGPHGTHKILNELGFDIDLRYIISVDTFNLYLPSHYRNAYGI
ncbi:hypothetical protein [Halalkalibacter flavus]|uniref:hypothetical protein n=1 Tax=Halalkalibacter flavus TaxID=3090668 RepID=UPI002FC5CD3B